MILRLKITKNLDVSSLALASAVILASAAHAQDAAPEGQNLGGVTVTDTAINEDEAETGYRVSSIRSATRTDTPLINTPQSVSVVTAKQIEDQAVNSISDAIRYLPGVYASQGEGNRETLVFRGNSTTGDFFVDGIRDDVQTYRDLYNIQRLEVFRGPNAMIFGRGGAGGVINRVTKVADWNPVREFRIEGGSDDHVRSTFDFGTPLSDAVAVRLTGVYQDSGSYRDHVDYHRWGFNPTASFKLGPDTLVQIGYEHFKDERTADRGIPASVRPAGFTGPIEPLKTPRGQFIGDPFNSPTFTNTDAGTFYIEHKFSDTVSIRNRTRYADYDKFYRNIYSGAVNDVDKTDPIGLPAGVYPVGTIVALSAYENGTQRKNLFSQTDLNAEFETGGIKHTLLLGSELGRQVTDNFRQTGYFGPNPTDTSTNVLLSNSAILTNMRWEQNPTDADNHGVAKVVAGYVQDQIEFSPMFQAIVGIRFDHFNVKFRNNRTAQRLDITDNVWSPRAGLIFKPVENASIYASFSRTFLPRAGDQLASLAATTAAFTPEKFNNYEVGAKWDLLSGFTVAAAVFKLDRDNVVVPDPNDPAVSILAGGQRTKGFELSASGNITDSWSVVASYSYQDSKFTRSTGNTVAGTRPGNVPKQSASLWTRYDITDAFGAAAGATYQGKRYAASDNMVVLPGYTRIDAALYYDVSDAVSVQLNVENLFNKRYFLFANSNTNITPGSPTAFKVALAAHF